MYFCILVRSEGDTSLVRGMQMYLRSLFYLPHLSEGCVSESTCTLEGPKGQDSKAGAGRNTVEYYPPKPLISERACSKLSLHPHGDQPTMTLGQASAVSEPAFSTRKPSCDLGQCSFTLFLGFMPVGGGSQG